MAETTSVEWVGNVFNAIHALTVRQPSTVSLFQVGASIGLAREQMTEQLLTSGEGIGAALYQGMTDLAKLGLVEFANVYYGNMVTAVGRDVHDLGLSTQWPPIFGIHLGDRALVFLARLVAMSEHRNDGWAERHAVSAKAVFADLGWLDEDDYRLTSDVHALVEELQSKGMVEVSGALNFGNMDVTPTYIAMVRMTQPDPTAEGASAGLLDWAEPAPGWETVEADLSALKLKLEAARTEHDFEDVGRRVREIAADAVMRMVDSSMAPSGESPPGSRDAEEWLRLLLESRLNGGPNEDIRGFVRKTFKLANAVTHGSSNRVVGAVATSQALITLVRTLQAIDRSEADEVEAEHED